MLAMEALFTAVLARRPYQETMGGRAWTAMALLLAGGSVLVIDQGRGGGAQSWGLLAVGFGEARPSPGAALALLAIGASGYGLSLRFYPLAQRAFGAARTGSVFAFAPFIGAAVAVAMGERAAGGMLVLGSGLMLAGVLLHLAESHGHAHTHEAMEHEHAHRHDDGHQDHAHQPMPGDAHSHRHRHRPLRHVHHHVPDAHHTHSH
jgi:drug/metabolite transporter (DMT)-like permease